MDQSEAFLPELERERLASMRVRVAGVALVSAAIWFSHWLWYESEIFPVLWHSQVYRAGQVAVCGALVALAAAARSQRVLERTATGILCALTLLHGFALLVVAEPCFVPFLLTLEWGNIVIALAAALSFRPSVALFVTTWLVGVVATRVRSGFDADLSDHIVLAIIYATVAVSIRNYDRARVAAHRTRQELAAANERLKRSDEARSRLFENLSHDFRTPLALISGDAERLELTQRETESKLGLQRIRENARAMAELTDQLLLMAKLDAKLQNPDTRTVDLQRLVEQSAAQFDGAGRRGRIELDCENVALASADPAHVRRILQNLLGNAVRQLERGANVVRLSLEDEGETIALSVRNDGPPIPEERRTLIFERFASFDASGSVASGIGLPLARELAELNQGRLELLASAHETVFRLTLPKGRGVPAPDLELTPVEAAVAVGEKPALREAPPQSLLIVEDHPQMTELLVSMLRDRYAVSTARSLREALETITRTQPDLVLADLMLPDGTSLELLEQLPALLDGVMPPVVFLSAAADERLRVEAFAKGAADFLLKPCSAEELRARLAAAARGAEELEHSLERQRKSFTAELHDGVNAALARAALLLEAAERRQRHELIPLARSAVLLALDQARSVSVLEARACIPFGAAASEIEAALCSALAGFDVTSKLTSQTDGSLPALTGVEHHTLGRLAIEAATNALKHGSPKHIACALTVTSGQVELQVTSDGAATRETKKNAALGSGKGLELARARLERLSGVIRSERGPFGGWVVTASFGGALSTHRPQAAASSA